MYSVYMNHADTVIQINDSEIAMQLQMKHFKNNYCKHPLHVTHDVSISVLCCISIISTMCRSIDSFGRRIARTASTTCCSIQQTNTLQK